MKKFIRLPIEQKRKTCATCTKEFFKPRDWSNLSWINAQYCSRECVVKNEGYLKKISEAHIGQNLGNRDRAVWKNCLTCEVPIRKWQKYCSNKCQPAWNKGKSNTWMVGDKNPNWKGGITPINKALRESFDYEEWRRKVFERDNYTCQGCGEVGGRLEADHKKPWSLYPDLRFELSNGRTLCKPCHRELGWNLFRENNPRRRVNL